MSIGRLIRTRRRWRGLTQTELAKLIGTNQTRISLWERGKDTPSGVQLEAIGRQLHAPIAERGYLDVTLPELLERLLLTGEVASQGHRKPPTDFAAERAGRLVATPFLLELAQTTPTVGALVSKWLDIFAAALGKSLPVGEKRDVLARMLAVDEISVAEERHVQLDDSYLSQSLPPPGSDGVLQRNVLSGVTRPILPRPTDPTDGSTLTLGQFIPVLRPVIMKGEPPLPKHLLDDPLHAAVMLLATCSRFPSSDIKAAIFDTPDGLRLDVGDSHRTWSGTLRDGVVALLRTVDLVCMRPLGRDGWGETTRLAVADLVREQLLTVKGPCIEVDEAFWSTVAANPGHQLNRGEKLSRARVSERLLSVLYGDIDG